jgi:Cu+-exporting ATPase
VDVSGVWGQRRVDLIAHSVREMVARKSATQAFTERFTRYLVPAICSIAAAVLIWDVVHGVDIGAAIERAVAVLVITCPCALGMAVPLALTAGVGQAARMGILFRDVEAIEKAGRISLFFLDKTGTLTEGAPRLVAWTPASGVSKAQLIEEAAIAEHGSEHPLAKVILSLRSEPVNCPAPVLAGTSRAVPGNGVEWRDENGTTILVGNRHFLTTSGIRPPEFVTDHTSVHVARNGLWRGCLLFADAPRQGAKQAVAAICKSGAQIAMLTGDDIEVAVRVAEAIGMATSLVFATQQPEAKAARIVTAQARGCIVAFVGDGLNDAPALAAADLGIAVGSASASSVAAASIVLVDGGIEKLNAALVVAKATARVMHQNLGAAVVYNLLAVPLAAGGFVAPAMAAALMIASSLSVTLNAARLTLCHPQPRQQSDLPPAPKAQSPSCDWDPPLHRAVQPESQAM